MAAEHDAGVADDRLGAAARAAPANAWTGSSGERRPLRARATIARPIGCSERDSSEAASCEHAFGASTPFDGRHADDVELPVVSVPVLSNATQRTAASRSRCAPPLMSTPLRAAAASAETIETGVEITSAHGQEITSSTSAR